MNDLERIQKEIERVRNSLNSLVASKKGDTTDPEVASLSILLDDLIVRYEQLKADNEAKR